MIKHHQEILSTIDSDMLIDQRLMGGMSNYTYLVTKNNKKYVFRIPGEGGFNFVDYNQEEKNLQLVDKLNINTKVIYLNPTFGYKISEYIEGNIIDNTVDLNKVSMLLKTLHTNKVKFQHDYGHFKRLEKYEAIHTDNNDEYFILKEQFKKLYESNLIMNLGVPCHNDAQIANIIIDNDQNLHLLDWEFAANNDPIYDIASFGNKDFNQALGLLEHYFDNPTNDHYLRLYAWRMFQCLQWYNVATFKQEVGLSKKLDVDFEKIAQMYITLAQTMYDNALKYLN